MPIYEFACPRCEELFEELRRMGDSSLPPCPKCGCKRTERRFSTFAMGGRSASSGGSGGSSSSCSGCARSSCAGCGH